jgi:hypothetical protein
VPRQLGVRRLMGRRNDFKPENGTLDSPYGHVSYWLYKNGQVRMGGWQHERQDQHPQAWR